MAYKKLKLWFDEELANRLASDLGKIKSDFDRSGFVQYISKRIPELELKPRVECMADALFVFLDSDYSTGVQILIQIMGPENENETGMFTEYYWLMPVAKYVEKYGLDHLDLSMEAMKEITKRNTAEYAIRPYIEKYGDRAMSQMREWSTDSNFHLRRLSCEGARPRLPWASKLDNFVNNPEPILSIIENLKDDKVKYVKTSVANTINDILKDNPEIAVDLIERWSHEDYSEHRRWIVFHALRNGRKKKEKWALDLMKLFD